MMEFGIKALAASIALYALIRVLPKLLAYVHAALTEDL